MKLWGAILNIVRGQPNATTYKTTRTWLLLLATSNARLFDAGIFVSTDQFYLLHQSTIRKLLVANDEYRRQKIAARRPTCHRALRLEDSLRQAARHLETLHGPDDC